ncbi:MAG: hypothetical protein FD146_444 [Anaerolineaceae bacterium]|nr:MAG: hypothetical protein FD146_444 [Anaerolineaceae bacterium]
MPTILFIYGWRLFFYSNERNEPVHIHARKGDVECKFWLYPNQFDIVEAHVYNANPADIRAIRRIIFDNFDYIVSMYEAHQHGELE